MVDRWTLTEVLEQLAIICDHKAEHLQTVWQDRFASEQWESNRKVLLKTTKKISY